MEAERAIDGVRNAAGEPIGIAAAISASVHPLNLTAPFEAASAGPGQRGTIACVSDDQRRQGKKRVP